MRHNAKKKGKNTPLVLATVKPYTRKDLPEYAVASYACVCGHSGAVQAGLKKPHCASCGDKVSIAKTVATASITRIENAPDAVSLECAGCSSHNIMAVATAIDFDGKVHCSACGEGLEFDPTELADVEDSLEDIDLDNDTGSDDLPDTIEATDEDDEDDDSEETTAGLDDDEVDSVDDIEDDETTAGLEDDDVNIEDLTEESDIDNEANEADDYLGGDIADESDPEDDEDDMENETAIAKVKPTPIHSTLKKATLAKARLVRDADKLHIFAGNHCIATAIPTKKNEKVFAKKTFAGLIEASLSDKGVVATIEDYGFTVATVTLSKAKALESTVASISAKSDEKVASKVAEHSKKLKQALQVASVGFNRDAFASNTSNPLKDGIYDLLVGLGVEPITASLKVQETFATAGDQYVESLLTKAHELSSFSDSSLNELASTFATLSVPTPNLAAIASMEEEEEEYDENDEHFADDTQSVEARLSNPIRQTTQANTNAGFGLFSRSTLR